MMAYIAELPSRRPGILASALGALQRAVAGPRRASGYKRPRVVTLADPKLLADLGLKPRHVRQPFWGNFGNLSGCSVR